MFGKKGEPQERVSKGVELGVEYSVTKSTSAEQNKQDRAGITWAWAGPSLPRLGPFLAHNWGGSDLMSAKGPC